MKALRNMTLCEASGDEFTNLVALAYESCCASSKQGEAVRATTVYQLKVRSATHQYSDPTCMRVWVEATHSHMSWFIDIALTHVELCVMDVNKMRTRVYGMCPHANPTSIASKLDIMPHRQRHAPHKR